MTVQESWIKNILDISNNMKQDQDFLILKCITSVEQPTQVKHQDSAEIFTHLQISHRPTDEGTFPNSLHRKKFLVLVCKKSTIIEANCNPS